MNRLPIFILSLLFIGLSFGFLGCGEDDSGPTGPTLNAPHDLVATAISETQISLSWVNEDEYISGYKIQRAEGAGSFSQIFQSEDNVLTYTDSDLSEGSTYSYKVQSFQRDTDSPLSGAATATTPPIAPSDLIAEWVSGSQINISWMDNSAVEENYEIQMRTSGTPDYETVATLDPDIVDYAAMDLTESTVYQFRVRAILGDNYSDWSNIAQQETVVFTPTAPSELEAETMGSSEIRLTWTDNSHNEAGFVIELSLTGTDGWAPKDSVDRNFGTRRIFTVGQLTGLTEYYFRVYAYNDSGPSPVTDVVNATTVQGPPLMPQDLLIETPDFTQAVLSWTDASEDEIGFILERKHESSNWGQVDSLVENTSAYIDDEVFPNNRYMYRICAVNEVGRSSWLASEDWTAIPDGPPNAPIDLEAVPIDMSHINLNWSDVSNNEGGFIVERSLSGAGEFEVIIETNPGVVFFGDEGLEQETSYDYRVKAFRVDEDGSYASDYTDIATATTFGPLSTPGNLTATPMNTSIIRLQWQDQSFAEEGFTIERSIGDENNFNPIDVVDANISTYLNTGLDESTSYSYRVVAFMEGESSDYSNIATAETFGRVVLEDGFEGYDVGAPPPEDSGWYPESLTGNATYTVTDERAMEGGSKCLYIQDPRGDNLIRVMKDHRPVVRSRVSFNVFVPSFGGGFGFRGWNTGNGWGWGIQMLNLEGVGNVFAVSNGANQEGNPQFTYTGGYNFPLGQWVNIEVISNCLTYRCDVFINGVLYADQYLFNYASAAIETIELIGFSNTEWEQMYVDDFLIEEVVDEEEAYRITTKGPVRDRGINIHANNASMNLMAR
ncbi:MAG: fibronectin type III domain-containing protein [Calditrichaeota bacterium]|nr:fibronectin type III domain-containing protein [Calditrichota bacterium]MBT7788425.1 fibronectin type III domain-containing protein [Calditrichota bacterium]